MNIPKNYKLVKEHPEHFEIHDEKDGKRFTIPKAAIYNATRDKILSIPKFADGGEKQPDASVDAPDVYGPPVPEQPKPEEDPGIAYKAGSYIKNNIIPGIEKAVENSPQAMLWHGFRDVSRGVLGAGPYKEEPSDQTPPSSTQPAQQSPDQPQPQSQPDQAAAAQSAQLQTGAASGSSDIDKFDKQINDQLSQMRANGQEVMKAYNDHVNKMSQLPSAMDVYNHFDSAQKDLEEKVAKSEIDPSRYYKNMGTGAKVLTAISLLFGGLTGSEQGVNNVIGSLRKNVDDDINAQMQNRDNKLTLFKMNQAMLGDNLTARAQTENQLLSMFQGQTQAIAAKNNYGPQAFLGAANTLLEIKKIKQMNNAFIAASHGQPGSEDQFRSTLNSLEQVNPSYHKDLQAKYLPGLGVASVPVPEDTRKAFASYDAMSGAIDRAIQFQKSLGPFGALPTSKEAHLLEGIKAPIAQETAKLQGLSRYTGIENESAQKALDRLGGPLSKQAIAQLEQMKINIQQHKIAEIKNLGIKPFTQQAAQTQYRPGDVVNYRGQKYQIAANGKTMIPVK